MSERTDGAFREAKPPAKAVDFPELSPMGVTKLRAQVARVVLDHVAHADAVLHGKRAWSSQQVNLFKALLNKVLPDISASYVESRDGVTRSITGMTRAELEVIARGGALDRGRENDVISTDYVDVSPDTATPPPPPTRADDGGAGTPDAPITGPRRVVTSPAPPDTRRNINRPISPQPETTNGK